MLLSNCGCLLTPEMRTELPTSSWSACLHIQNSDIGPFVEKEMASEKAILIMKIMYLEDPGGS